MEPKRASNKSVKIYSVLNVGFSFDSINILSFQLKPMSLPSPLSVGDAILLAQLAYNVAKAFSTGAKSAPAEFEEVRNLLYAVSESLKLLASNLPPTDEAKGQKGCDTLGLVSDNIYIVVGTILANCRGILQHLEAFIQKYSILEKSKQPSGLEVRGWKNELMKNWKKIIWTSEGGDITKLKQTLTAHITSLNLAVALMNG